MLRPVALTTAVAVCLVAASACGPRGGSAWLADATRELGVEFAHESGAVGEFQMPEIMGSGLALFDHDGDGDLDLYLVNGNLDPREGRVAAGGPRNALFRREADGRFADVTGEAGLGDAGYGMGVAVGDADNDGDPDVYVANHGPDRFYRNRGDGTFEDATAAVGIDVGGWSSSAIFLDYDRDGWLDLFVARYVRHDPGKRCTDAAGRPDYCAPQVFAGLPDVLLRNEGGVRFRDVSAAAGLTGTPGPGLGVVAADFDGDGWPDLYVANDGKANRLWINGRDGTFRDEALRYGVAYDVEGRAEAGMGVVAEDLDGDLDLDLFLTHLAGESNTLYARGRSGGFADETALRGLAAESLPYTGFGVVALDLELDGDLDLAVANGRVTRGTPRPESGLAPPWDAFAEPNRLFLNDGSGRFARAGPEVAPFETPTEISRGLAAGDLDDDGDLDLVLTNVEGPARVLLNHAPRRGGWLAVRAIDPRRRRDALGAGVLLVTERGRVARTIAGGSGYLTSGPAVAHFGLPGGVVARAVEVRWPDGVVETFAVPAADRILVLVRGGGEAGS